MRDALAVAHAELLRPRRLLADHGVESYSNESQKLSVSYPPVGRPKKGTYLRLLCTANQQTNSQVAARARSHSPCKSRRLKSTAPITLTMTAIPMMIAFVPQSGAAAGAKTMW
jgi:hypothetical protein